MEQKSRALISYARADDQNHNVFFSRFRERLSSEVRAQTGKDFQIFQDTEDIRWGQYFQERVEDTIQALTFFIPIITPNFFKSEYCRDELRRFLRREEALQRIDLILPVYYLDSELLEDRSQTTSDVLAQTIAMRERLDWRNQSVDTLDSVEAQQMLERMATQIHQAIQDVSKPVVPVSVMAEAQETISEQPAMPDIAPAPVPSPTATPVPAPARRHDRLHLQGILQQNAGTIIHSVAFSHDGRFLVLGGRDHAVQIWDLATAEEIQRFEGHTSYVTSVAFNPNGRMVASGSRDKTIRLWQIDGEREGRILQGHNSRVTNLSFSPDGTLLASCGEDKSVRLWDVSSGKQLRRMEGHTRLVSGVAFNTDGTMMASCGEDRSARVWEVRTGREILRLDRHKDHVRGVAFSPDNVLLATASEDKTMYLWDIASGRVVRRLEHFSHGVESVAFSPDGSLVACGGRDKTVWFYEMTQEPDMTAESKWGDNMLLAAWEMGETREIIQLKGAKDYIRSLVFSSDGFLLALVTDSYTVRLCGMGMPEYRWENLEHTWHDLCQRRVQRRHSMGRCEECGARLTFWERLSRVRLCKDCR